VLEGRRLRWRGVKVALERGEGCVGEGRRLRWRGVKVALERGEGCVGEGCRRGPHVLSYVIFAATIAGSRREP
jgi:hypothetical protein